MKDIPEVMSSEMTPGSIIQSRAKRCETVRARWALTAGTGKEPWETKGHREGDVVATCDTSGPAFLKTDSLLQEKLGTWEPLKTQEESCPIS